MLSHRAPWRLLLAVVTAAVVTATLTTADVARGEPAVPAARPITGRLVDDGTRVAVDGATVRLRRATRGGPGAVVATDVTDGRGRFSLPTEADERYYVQLVAGEYQPGWADESPGAVFFRLSHAVLYRPGDALGPIGGIPAFISGRLVDSETLRPVGGVRLTARSQNDPASVEAAALTRRDGSFHLAGIDFEDDGLLKVHGAPQGYETGWFGCGFRVVPLEDACATNIGVFPAKLRIDKS